MILRKREGLIQCVFEEGVTKFELKDLKEGGNRRSRGSGSKRRSCSKRHRDPFKRDPYLVRAECSNAACDLKMETEYILRGKAKQPCRIS